MLPANNKKRLKSTVTVAGTGTKKNTGTGNSTNSTLSFIVIILLAMNLTVSAINCNSLNMSHASKKNQALKIHGITKLKTDIILLSDTRLSNKNLVSAANDIKKTFSANLNQQYEFFYNSTKNKRGTGILINSSMNFSVLDRWDEEDENSLLLKVDIAGEHITIGSIYGPNELNENFFVRLKNKLIEWGCTKTILGGDWNCLFSSDSVDYNIDCINMVNCPNAGNSVVLNDLCAVTGLFDPYRYLYPDRRDYSYVPKDRTKKNRTRLDFFLVSSDLLGSIRNCDIVANLQNSLFDHKAIFLEIGAYVPARTKTFKIRNAGLNIDTLDILVECAVAEAPVAENTQKISVRILAERFV
jgi:exonuclease III